MRKTEVLMDVFNVQDSAVCSYSGEGKLRHGFLLLCAGYDSCSAKYRFRLEAPTYNVILHFHAGSGYLQYGEDVYYPAPGDTFILQKGRTWEWFPLSTSPWEYDWMNVDGPLFFSLLENYGLSETVKVSDSSHVGELFSRCYAVMNERQNRYAIMTDQVALIVMQMCQELARVAAGAEVRRTHPWAHAMRYYIDNHYAENIGNSDIANVEKISVTTAVKVFSDSYGMSPCAYLKKVRMDHAALLLSNSNETVKNIAERVGFCNVHHFCNRFLAFYGISPGEYRRRSGNYARKKLK